LIVLFKSLRELIGSVFNSQISNKFLFKGQLVYFEGKLRTKSWDDKNGTKKYKTEIFCSQITPLEWKKSS